jgi:ferredoxin
MPKLTTLKQAKSIRPGDAIVIKLNRRAVCSNKLDGSSVVEQNEVVTMKQGLITVVCRKDGGCSACHKYWANEIESFEPAIKRRPSTPVWKYTSSLFDLEPKTLLVIQDEITRLLRLKLQH